MQSLGNVWEAAQSDSGWFHNTEQQHKGKEDENTGRRHMQNSPVCSILHPACVSLPYCNKENPKEPNQQRVEAKVISTPFTPHRQKVLCDIPAIRGQLPRDFWCDDNGLGLRNSGLLPVIPGGPPSPHKGLQAIISAHSKRPPSVGEKLSPFISIHIHP